jgi:hypothetical protein
MQRDVRWPIKHAINENNGNVYFDAEQVLQGPSERSKTGFSTLYFTCLASMLHRPMFCTFWVGSSKTGKEEFLKPLTRNPDRYVEIGFGGGGATDSATLNLKVVTKVASDPPNHRGKA